MNKERLIALSLIILIAALSRLAPHPQNVAPIAAIALFAGAHFEKKWLAFSVPIVAMVLSDIVIYFSGHYSNYVNLFGQMYITYIGFMAVVLVGFFLRGRVKPFTVIGASLTGSVLFFLITNNALWSHNDLYPKTLEGVIASYTVAIPFFKNTLLGDLFYNILLFGGFALAERRFVRLRKAVAS